MTTARHDTAIARLRALEAGLPPHDGVAVFGGICLAAVLALRRQPAGDPLPRPRTAADPAAGLVADLARRYLTAVDRAAAGEPAPACWRPLLLTRHHPGVRPVQFALAGLNACLGHDLPLAVVAAAESRGCTPEALRGAFERIGDVLAGLAERVCEEPAPGAGPLDVTDPLTHLVCGWHVEGAREAAWSAVGLLWSLRRLPGPAEPAGPAGEFTRRLDTGLGLVGRFLLTPLESRPAPRTG
ncbi:DUF5995 family protein [Streptomyces sp. TRM 70361]|uniref:DUF5995 family protein n=1 Tax=Streptomyces sp. TRM 70361 TaxID=3116553 RepID=UPI002E7B6B15|nr:DUF5995 family protein [Streptomyces sp. TRM 70361]MEE1938997.1 DUF5995 family protein [Streptomyces sp. TRM 70361]